MQVNRFILLLGGALALAQLRADEGALEHEASDSAEENSASGRAALSAIHSVAKVRAQLVSRMPERKKVSFRKTPYSWVNYGADLALNEGLAAGSMLALMGGTALYESTIKAHVGTFFGGYGSLLADAGLDFGLSSSWSDFGYRALISSVSWSLGNNFGPVPPAVLRYALTYGGLLHETAPDIWQGYFLPRFEGHREIELLNPALSRLFKIYYHTPGSQFTPDTGSPWLELSFAYDNTDVVPSNNLEAQLIHLRAWAQKRGIEGIHLYPGRLESELKLWVAPVRRGIPGQRILVPGRFGGGGASIWWTQFVKKSYPEKLNAYLLSPLHEDVLAVLPAVLSGERVRPVTLSHRVGKLGFNRRSSYGLSAVPVGKTGFLLFDSHSTQGYEIPEILLDSEGHLDKVTLEALRSMDEYRNPAPSRGAHKLITGIVRTVAYRAAVDWMMARIKVEPKKKTSQERMESDDVHAFTTAEFPRVPSVQGQSHSDGPSNNAPQNRKPQSLNERHPLVVSLLETQGDNFLVMPRVFELSKAVVPRRHLERWEEEDLFVLSAINKQRAAAESERELKEKRVKEEKEEKRAKASKKKSASSVGTPAQVRLYAIQRRVSVCSALKTVENKNKEITKKLSVGKGKGKASPATEKTRERLRVLAKIARTISGLAEQMSVDVVHNDTLSVHTNWDALGSMAKQMSEAAGHIGEAHQHHDAIESGSAMRLLPNVRHIDTVLSNLKSSVETFTPSKPSEQSVRFASTATVTLSASASASASASESRETDLGETAAELFDTVSTDLIPLKGQPIQVLVMGRSAENIHSVLSDIHKTDPKLVATATDGQQYVVQRFKPVPIGSKGSQIAYTTVTLSPKKDSANALPVNSEILEMLVSESHKLLWVGNLQEHEKFKYTNGGKPDIDDEELLFNKVLQLNNKERDLAVVLTRTNRIIEDFARKYAVPGEGNELLPSFMNPVKRKQAGSAQESKVLVHPETLKGRGLQSVYSRVQGAFQSAKHFYSRHANGGNAPVYGYKDFLPPENITLLGNPHYLSKQLYVEDLSLIKVNKPVSWMDLLKTYLVRDSSPVQRAKDTRIQ